MSSTKADKPSSPSRGAAQSPAARAKGVLVLGRYRLEPGTYVEACVPLPGFDTREERDVSVTFLSRPLGDEERERLPWRRRVEHPAVPAVLAAEEHPAGYVIVTERVRGEPLVGRVGGERARLSSVVRLLLPAAAGLDALHDAGLVHGALDLRGVYVAGVGDTVLVGAGLPRREVSELGPFVAPEVARGGARSPAADIYALGAVLSDCLHGERDPADHGDLPAAILAALSPDPAARPPRADALLAQAAAEGLEQGGLRPTRSRPPARAVAAGGRGARPHAARSGSAAPRSGSAAARRAAPRRRLPVSGGTLARLAALLLFLLVSAGAAVAGSRMAASATTEPAPPVFARGADGVVLQLPESWNVASTPRGRQALGLREPLALEVAGVPAAGLIAGRADDADPRTLLPPTVQAVRRRPERIGAARGWRYDRAAVPALPRQEITLFAMPAARGGPVLLACHAPGGAQVLLLQCEDIVTAATLPPPGRLDPDPAYARSLSGPLARLDAAATPAARRLSTGKTNRTRARAALALGAAYDRAASALRTANPTTGARADDAALRSGFQALAAGYVDLGVALRARSRARSVAALRRVRAARARTATAARRLAALGYRSG